MTLCTSNDLELIVVATEPGAQSSLHLKFCSSGDPSLEPTAHTTMSNPNPAFVPSAVPSIGSTRSPTTALPRPDAFITPSVGVPASSPSHLTQPLPQRSASRPHPDGGAGCSKGTVVVQLRSDLRVHDHPALTHALEEGARVVPVFVFDTRQFGSTSHGFQRTGKYRARFLIESVSELRTAMESLGGGLVVRVGIPEKVIPDVCKSVGAKRVFVHREINFEEQESERKLEEALKPAGGSLQRFWSNTLYYEDDLPFALADMPDVYTDFREAVQARAIVREPLQAPERLPALPKGVAKGEIPTLADLGIADAGETSRQTTDGGVGRIKGGEVEAMRRLRAYVEERKMSSSEYGKMGDPSTTGPDFSCRISPWLALGCLSPRVIFEEMKKTAPSARQVMKGYTFYELVWRDFFRCITAKYSQKRAGAGADKVKGARASMTAV